MQPAAKEQGTMKYMQPEWQDRISHWINTLKKDFYLPLGKISVEAFQTMEQLSPDEAAAQPFSPMEEGTQWGHTWEYCWMKSRIVLPESAAGKRIVLDLQTGGESTVFVDGKSFGTRRAEWVQVPHHYLVDNFLTLSAEPGKAYDLLIEAYAGHFYPESELGGCATGPVLPGSYMDPKGDGLRTTLGKMTYGIWNEEAYQLYMDMETLRLLGDRLDQESLRADRVASALEKATVIIDFEQPLEEREKSYHEARLQLKEVLSAENGSTSPLFYAIGNAHLDLAWLWPMAETRRKPSRTFAQQLRLLEAYPEYKYLQSQPAAYEMCRECYPELFDRIVAAAKRGQWIPEGAMWVEPDTNMTSGESLIRQLLHGKKYFRDVFGVDSVLLWLPDTFGYSAALPQILKGTGVKYLVTQKIFWSYNAGDRFPYHYFTWQGADGSEIVSFLPTSYTYRTDPEEISATWEKRVQKRDLDTFLLPFGYGDGGGGPTRDHIEFIRREQNLEGMPRVKMENPVRFFEDMEHQGGPVHTYVGELYFSAHRGVYTSQAAIKKGNRKAELALREAEIWGSLAACTGWHYPGERIDAAWKRLLLNQFHDILPGSSIARVYEDARRDHQWIISEANDVCRDALSAMTEQDGFSVFNSLSFDRYGVVEVPPVFAEGARTAEGEPVAVCQSGDKYLAHVRVPAFGNVSLIPDSNHKTSADTPGAFARLTPDGAEMENSRVQIRLNSRGEIVSFVDKKSGREFADGCMNRLRMFKDVPRKFDAWDIDSNYALQPVSLDEAVSISVSEPEGLRAVIHVSRAVQHSLLEQDIVLEAESGRLDFVTEMDWHELHRLLKVEFPVRVQASEGINEIQFGYIRRPTHRSRPYDSDRYEVCNQRYSALADESHGAAVLNDCKYGISMEDNRLQLTLLRAAASPEMRADNGHHRFVYAFIAWEGSFLESPVVQEAYSLNVPLLTVPHACNRFSAFQLDAPNVFIDTVKPAEDLSGDLVLRLYEAKKADTLCRLSVAAPVSKVWLCDMLENRQDELKVENGSIPLSFHTFEIKTIRISFKKG